MNIMFFEEMIDKTIQYQKIDESWLSIFFKY